MKGAVIVHGKRIEVGQRVEIIVGPFSGRFGLFKGRSRKRPRKIVVTPWGSTTHLFLNVDAIRRAETKP